jgi:hypothetical protein
MEKSASIRKRYVGKKYNTFSIIGVENYFWTFVMLPVDDQIVVVIDAGKDSEEFGMELDALRVDLNNYYHIVPLFCFGWESMVFEDKFNRGIFFYHRLPEDYFIKTLA